MRLAARRVDEIEGLCCSTESHTTAVTPSLAIAAVPNVSTAPAVTTATSPLAPGLQHSVAVLAVGDRCEAQFGRGREWFLGRVARVQRAASMRVALLERYAVSKMRFDWDPLGSVLRSRFVTSTFCALIHRRKTLSKETKVSIPRSKRSATE